MMGSINKQEHFRFKNLQCPVKYFKMRQCGFWLWADSCFWDSISLCGPCCLELSVWIKDGSRVTETYLKDTKGLHPCTQLQLWLECNFEEVIFLLFPQVQNDRFQRDCSLKSLQVPFHMIVNFRPILLKHNTATIFGRERKVAPTNCIFSHRT